MKNSPVLCRRGFIAGASAAATLPLAAEDRPRLRFGVMTDTHVTRNPESFERSRLAVAAFRKLGCRMFCHLGDLADEFCPEAYAMWRQTVDGAMAGCGMKELYVYAAHDFYNYQGRRWKLSREEVLAAYGEFGRAAGLPNGLYTETAFDGVPFVAGPQHVKPEELEPMIARAEARFPTGPIFVLNHIAPMNTMFNSYAWGCWWLPSVLNRHPRVICLSGHTHGSVTNEFNIWQGGFTAVDAGCLQSWVAPLSGRQSKSKRSFGVLVCDVFDSHVAIRRIDVRTCSDARPPWIVPLPFDPSAAPFRVDVRRAAAPRPSFPPGAKLQVDAKSSETAVTVAFPAAAPADDVFCYRVAAQRRDVLLEWVDMSREDVYGEFYLRPEDRKGEFCSEFLRDNLKGGRVGRYVVTPVGFFGQCGEALVAKA